MAETKYQVWRATEVPTASLRRLQSACRAVVVEAVDNEMRMELTAVELGATEAIELARLLR